MTSRQLHMYRAEAGKAVKAMRDRGHTGSVDVLRHQLTVEALGYDKSSLDFTNAEFDKVLAVVWSHADAGDLDVQLAQLDQPIKRLQWLSKRHLRAAGVDEHGLDYYLIGIGKRMFPGRPVYFLETFSEAEWRDILVACNRHRQRAEKRRLKGAPF